MYQLFVTYSPPPLLPVRGCACHCGCLCCGGLNSVTSFSCRSVHFSQYPMLLAIVSASSGYTPLCTQARYWGGQWAGFASIPKETPLPPSSLICFQSRSSLFLPPMFLRLREVKEARYTEEAFSAAASILLQAACIRCPRCTEDELQFLHCEWGGEVMSQENSCCRVCSRGLYSCHWREPSQNKRKVSISSHGIMYRVYE